MLTMVKRLLRHLLSRLDPEKQWDYPDITREEALALTGVKDTPMQSLRKGLRKSDRFEAMALSVKRRKLSRQEVIDLAREAGIILPSGGPNAPAPPEPEKQLVPYAMHRGRAFAADPNNNTLTKPKDLSEIVELLKALGHPFLMVAHKDKDGRGVHGWCNGSNWGRTVLEDLARCAELNFKLEMEKCQGQDRHYQGEKRYSGRPAGEFLTGSDAMKYLK